MNTKNTKNLIQQYQKFSAMPVATLNALQPVAALLVLGLGGRFAALGLTVVNLVAVASLADIAPAALQQHVFWGRYWRPLPSLAPGGFRLMVFGRA
jgi:hypothetical protein